MFIWHIQIFTVNLLGTEIFDPEDFTQFLYALLKACFYNRPSKFFVLNSSEIKHQYPLIWISCRSFVSRWNFRKLPLSFQPIYSFFYYYFQNCSALSLWCLCRVTTEVFEQNCSELFWSTWLLIIKSSPKLHSVNPVFET